MIAKGSDNLSKIYLGSTEITKAYLGTEQIYPNEVPYTTSDLTFTTNTGLINTAQVFTATNGGFGNTGLDVLFLAANQNGRVYLKIQAADAINTILGFSDVNAEVAIAGVKAGFDLAAGFDLYRWVSGASYNPGVLPSTGQYLAVYRVGGVLKYQISNDGLAWTDIQEFMFGFTFSSANAIYAVCVMFATAVMYHPKIDIYGTGNLARLFIQDGDSIGAGSTTPGNFSTTNIGFQGYAALQNVSDTFYKNVSVGGASVEDRITALSTAVYPLFGQVGNSFDKIIVAMNCGVNNIHGGNSAATLYATMMTYVNDVLNQDSRTCVMVYTVCNCDPAYASNAVRLAYNALLMATPSTSRLKIVDITGTAALNDATAYLDLTYYQSDGLHLTQAGYDLLGALGVTVALSF